MKINKTVFLFCLFCISCAVPSATEDISVNFPENTQTPLAPSKKLTHIAPKATETPPIQIESPVLSEGLPDEMKVNIQELPIRFETPISSIPSGDYVVYSTSAEQPFRHDLEEPTIEFWAVSIDTYEKHLLFVCEKCHYVPHSHIIFNSALIYFETDKLSSEDERKECKITTVNLNTRRATRFSVDMSLFSPESPFFHCVTSSAVRAYYSHLFIPQFRPSSPSGEWMIFGTASALEMVNFPDDIDTPAKSHTLLLYSTKTDKWLILETGYSIASILWAPNEDLLVNVNSDGCDGLCGGETSTYLVSPDSLNIRDVGNLFQDYEQEAKIITSIIGWLPDQQNIAVRVEDKESGTKQIGVCPAKIVETFDISQCKILEGTPHEMATNTDVLALSEKGIFYLGWTDQTGEYVFLLRTDGQIENRGFLSDSYIHEISLSLNKILISTGENRDVLTYADLDDVSILNDFQVHVPNGIITAFWMSVP